MNSILFCFVAVLAGCLLVYAEPSKIEQQQLKHIEESSAFDMFQNFREPKKIAFSALMGGSSHIHWVISILDELNSRGHETTFITKDDQMKFVKNYPNIKAISIGNTFTDEMEDIMRNLRDQSPLDAAVDFVEIMGSLFKDDFIELERLLNEGEYDVVICDTFNTACIEAANKKGVATILSSTFPQSKDASAPYINNAMGSMNVPTSQFMGFWERLEITVINPAKFFWRLRHYIPKRRKMYKNLGIQDLSSPMGKWKDSVKMFNTAFGIQQGRPLGPLVEFVGPIVKHHIPTMSPDLQNFYDSHRSVAYIAFGQHAIMTSNDVKMLITGLLESYENEEIDGIVWATRGLENTFPEKIVTQSNTTYDVKRFFNYNNQSDIVFLHWAPQMAILNHPSTSFFISHGGSGSLYESLYSGVRMVIFPFFGDQLGAAVTGEKNGYAVRLDYRATQDEATRIIRKVARDEDNSLQKNADRFKALLQIRSKHGVLKGADLVEEVLFLQENGKVLHRRDVREDMSFIKANNLDIYAFVLTVALSGVYIVIRLFMQVSSMNFCTNKPKQKTA